MGRAVPPKLFSLGDSHTYFFRTPLCIFFVHPLLPFSFFGFHSTPPPSGPQFRYPWPCIRGRPLMIWGGGRRNFSTRIFFSPELLPRNIFLPEKGRENFFFLDFLRAPPRSLMVVPLQTQV